MSNSEELTWGKIIVGWDGFIDLPMFVVVCCLIYTIVTN